MKILRRYKTNKKIIKISDFPISFISAPGGFGKTTNLNNYLSSLNIHCTYFSMFGNLDERWAFSKIISFLSAQIGVSLDTQIPVDRHEIEFFISAVEEASELPVYLILDDVTLDNIPMILKMIQTYSYAPSSKIHIIVITRDSVLDQFYSLCVTNCFTMDYLDFLMDEDEIEMLCKIEEVSLSSVEIHDVFNLTSGWISAIQLVLQSYKRTKCLFCASPIESLIRNTLWNELEVDVQTCLMKLSILNEFTLEQALELDHNEAMMAAILELERAHYFIQINIPCTYSIVPIFKEFLHKELLLSTIDVDKLYQSTGKWFLSKKQPLDAIAMFLKCNDFDNIMRIHNDYSEISFVDIAPEMMIHVYTTVPDYYIARYPQIYFRWVCDCITNLPSLDTHALLNDLKHRIDTLQIPGDQHYLLGEYYYIYAFTQFNNVEKMFENFVIAYHYFNGGTSRAVSPLMTATFGSYHVAFLYFNQIGNYRALIDIVVEKIKYFIHISQGINEGSELQVQAEYAFDTANYSDVLSHAVSAYNRAIRFKQISVAVASLFVQGRHALLHFDTFSFKLVEQQLLEIMSTNSLPIVHSEIECALAHLHILNEELDKVPSWIQLGNFEHSKILHEASLIPRIVRGIYLVKTHQYEPLHQLTDYMDENNPNQMYAYAYLYTTMFKAILSYNYETSNYESTYFNQLLELCAHDHIISPVVELSLALEPLIHYHIIKNEFEQELITLCLEHNQQLKTVSDSTDLTLKLTKKEISVLAKVAENKKLKEIALELYISTNTVQTHLKSIYRKLNVNTKVEAIRYYESSLKRY